MQNREHLKTLLLALGLALGGVSIPVGTAQAQAIVNGESADGSVELGNTSGADDPSPAAQEPGAADAANSPATENAEAKPPKDPREAYRDLVLKDPEVVQGATSAVSRRYRKVDKATYNEMLQSGAAQPAQ
jgi:hypothetical protein